MSPADLGEEVGGLDYCRKDKRLFLVGLQLSAPFQPEFCNRAKCGSACRSRSAT